MACVENRACAEFALSYQGHLLGNYLSKGTMYDCIIPLPREGILIRHHFDPVFEFRVRRCGLWAAPLSGVML